MSLGPPVSTLRNTNCRTSLLRSLTYSSASNHAFQCPTALHSASTARSGAHTGAMIEKTVRTVPAPSMNAESSSSPGTVMRKLRVMIKYHALVANGRINAHRDPSSPRCLMLRYVAMRPPSKNSVNRKNRMIVLRNGNPFFEIA